MNEMTGTGDSPSDEKKADDELCAICLDGDVFDNNEIIFCDKCNVPVHQQCYGVATIPDGEWLCEVCAAGDDPATTVCELCSNTGGAYKPVDRPGKWIHSLCATWVPEVFVSENNGNSIYTLSHLDKKRFKLKCVICNTSKGASVQCCYGKCVTPAHPWCAIRMPEKGFTRRIIKNEYGVTVWEIFCKTHAHGVSEPLKPKPKSKSMLQLAAAPIIDPNAAAAEEDRKGVSLMRVNKRGGDRRSGVMRPLFSMAHSVKKDTGRAASMAAGGAGSMSTKAQGQGLGANGASARATSSSSSSSSKRDKDKAKAKKPKGRRKKGMDSDDDDDDEDDDEEEEEEEEEDEDEDEDTQPHASDLPLANTNGTDLTSSGGGSGSGHRTFPILTLNDWPGQTEGEAMDLGDPPSSTNIYYPTEQL